VKICGNSGYLFGGVLRNQPGIYRESFTNSVGCDSLVVLTLNIAAPDTQRISASICSGTTYSFNGQNLSQSGIYSVSLVNSKGCDSIVILNLNVNSNPVVSVYDTICRGQVYSFGGQNYSNSGQYSYVTVNSTGCTTTVVLNLLVNEIQKANITANGPLEFCGNGSVTLTASAGRSYLWSNGSRSSSILVNQSQSVWVEVIDVNGCTSRSDSQVVVQRLNIPNRPDSIIGFLNPCGIRGTSNTYTYSVPADANATSYSWLLMDGITAVGRTDSNAISVVFPAGFTTGQLRVTLLNACGSTVPRAKYFKTAQPTGIPVFQQSVTSVCDIRGTATLATYNISQIDGCGSYQWTVPANSTLVSGQGTATIQVRFSSTFSSGNISVVGVSPCGNSPSKSISVVLLAKPIISGPTVLCSRSQATYTVPVVPGAIRYRFNLPAGLTLISQNANSAVILNSGSFVSGSLGVQVQTTACGWSQPGTISINTAGCRTNNSELTLSIYPNPSRGEFQIQLGDVMNRLEVKVYAMDGRMVERETFGLGQIHSLNYPDLSEGLYQVEILATDLSNNVHHYLEKIVVEK